MNGNGNGANGAYGAPPSAYGAPSAAGGAYGQPAPQVSPELIWNMSCSPEELAVLCFQSIDGCKTPDYPPAAA